MQPPPCFTVGIGQEWFHQTMNSSTRFWEVSGGGRCFLCWKRLPSSNHTLKMLLNYLQKSAMNMRIKEIMLPCRKRPSWKPPWTSFHFFFSILDEYHLILLMTFLTVRHNPLAPLTKGWLNAEMSHFFFLPFPLTDLFFLRLKKVLIY